MTLKQKEIGCSSIDEDDDYSYEEMSVYSNPLSVIWEETLDDLMQENGLLACQGELLSPRSVRSRRTMRRSSLGSPSPIITKRSLSDSIASRTYDFNATDHTPDTADSTISFPGFPGLDPADDDEFTFVTCSDNNSFLDDSLRSDCLDVSHRSYNGMPTVPEAQYRYQESDRFNESLTEELLHSDERRRAFQVTRNQLSQKKLLLQRRPQEEALELQSGKKRRESFESVKNIFLKMNPTKVSRSKDQQPQEQDQRRKHFEESKNLLKMNAMKVSRSNDQQPQEQNQRRKHFEESKNLLQEEQQRNLRRRNNKSLDRSNHSKKERERFGGLQRSASYRKSNDLFSGFRKKETSGDNNNSEGFGSFLRSESFKIKKRFTEQASAKIKKTQSDECSESSRFGGFMRSDSFRLTSKKVDQPSENSRFGGFMRSDSFRMKSKQTDKPAENNERFGGFVRSESFKVKKKEVDQEIGKRRSSPLINAKSSKSSIDKSGGSRRTESYQKAQHLIQRFNSFKRKRHQRIPVDEGDTSSSSVSEIEISFSSSFSSFNKEDTKQALPSPPAVREVSESLPKIDPGCFIVDATSTPSAPAIKRPPFAQRRCSTGDMASPLDSNKTGLFSPTLREKKLKRELARQKLRRSFEDFKTGPVVSPAVPKQVRRASLPAECSAMPNIGNTDDQPIGDVHLDDDHFDDQPVGDVVVSAVDEDFQRLIKTLENSPTTMTPRPKLRKAKSNLRNALKELTFPNLVGASVVAA